VHVILGALGSIVTLLWILHRLADMGVDLGGLNPWAWRRRRKWRSTFEANPIFSITSPMEVTALLIAATAKADGDMSADEKQAILQMFEQEFRLANAEAASLLAASTHLLGKGEEVRDKLEAILAPSLDKFSAEQAQSAIDLLQRIAAVAGAATVAQAQLIERARALLLPDSDSRGKWD
jgi:tellurite resistance protein